MPRRKVEYRDTVLEEMDLPGVLARNPELALIDELAHTNAPGVEHEKRYEDIADVLAAGIDVFSTVNVQHLESLNDQVAELTGVRVRETVPDSVLGTADEVVLMDLTPEALIARLRAGKVYPDQNIDAALNNFFRIENLAALREVSLRQVAENVELKRLVIEERTPEAREEERVEADVPKAVGERILALIRPAAELATPDPAGLALGAAAGGRRRPAVGEAAGSADVGGQGEAARGAAPAGVGAGRRASDRGERRRGRGGRGGGPPPGHHLHLRRRVATRDGGWRGCASPCRSG